MKLRQQVLSPGLTRGKLFIIVLDPSTWKLCGIFDIYSTAQRVFQMLDTWGTVWDEMSSCPMNWEVCLPNRCGSLFNDHRFLQSLYQPPLKYNFAVPSIQKWSLFLYILSLGWSCDLFDQQNVPEVTLCEFFSNDLEFLPLHSWNATLRPP